MQTYKTDVPAIWQASKIFTRYSTVSFICPFLFSLNNKNGQTESKAPGQTESVAHQVYRLITGERGDKAVEASR